MRQVSSTHVGHINVVVLVLCDCGSLKAISLCFIDDFYLLLFSFIYSNIKINFPFLWFVYLFFFLFLFLYSTTFTSPFFSL